jgi:hypothetical protein
MDHTSSLALAAGEPVCIDFTPIAFEAWSFTFIFRLFMLFWLQNTAGDFLFSGALFILNLDSLTYSLYNGLAVSPHVMSVLKNLRADILHHCWVSGSLLLSCPYIRSTTSKISLSYHFCICSEISLIVQTYVRATAHFVALEIVFVRPTAHLVAIEIMLIEFLV